MKRRYRTSAWSQHVDYEAREVHDPADMTVYEPDRAPRPSGLLDAGGHPILVSDELDAGYLNEEFDELREHRERMRSKCNRPTRIPSGY